MTYPEEQWRCPSDGAFHIADVAQRNFDTNRYPCTKCGLMVDRELVEEGMANAVNEPETLPYTAIETINHTEVCTLIISDHGDLLVKVYFDGRLEFGPNYTPDKTARIFWEAMAGYAPYKQTP